ncbi:hypothetical protein [Falsiroseomonas selenitidurans]|uniref:Uncharacterized protein n=1 Tax=Falsiroseomonas selenitidurans TaxID=2716335 RepID=A0ABX1E8E3_9PROT|nr:hypothetical protein [Falsiroseomonas selenitidurans]NKC33484.1 hypothetical protein [Falsiroseomonas selenitidurans]
MIGAEEHLAPGAGGVMSAPVLTEPARGDAQYALNLLDVGLADLADHILSFRQEAALQPARALLRAGDAAGCAARLREMLGA